MSTKLADKYRVKVIVDPWKTIDRDTSKEQRMKDNGRMKKVKGGEHELPLKEVKGCSSMNPEDLGL